VDQPPPPREAAGRKPVVVGLISSEGLAAGIAEGLAEELPAALRERFREREWRLELSDDPLPVKPSTSDELMNAARERLREHGWDLGICLTDLPLRTGRRPVTALASATHGIALVSIPALGAVDLADRVQDEIVHAIEGLLGESAGSDGGGHAREARMEMRLEELADRGRVSVKGRGMVRVAVGVLRGNMRLLAGMVRANNPWTVIARLSRTLAGALGTGAVSLAAATVWIVSDRMTWPRLLLLSFATVAGTTAAIIAAHELWERTEREQDREQVMLFNLVTALTLLLGCVALYGALFLGILVCAGVLIPPSALKDQLGHSVNAFFYVKLAWLASSLATVGGALGSVVETDLAVRDAAYRYRGGGSADAAEV
jgi:uncharacterized membrane protein